MTVYNIQRIFVPNGSLVRIITDSQIEEVIAPGWLGLQRPDIERINNGPFEWADTDSVLLSIIVPLDALQFAGVAKYTNIFTVFPDHNSLNPNAALIPNLQNIIAHPGGGQTLATQLNIGINVITVVAADADSVKLPTDVLGQTVIISNRGANETAVYPSLGDNIDRLAANAPIFIFPGETYILYGASAQNWASVNISPVLTSNQNITAHAGGGQANAVELNVGLSVVTTAVSANDSVRLPSNSVGQIFWVVNAAASAVAIFPPDGANFQGAAANAPISLATNQSNLIVGATPTLFAQK